MVYSYPGVGRQRTRRYRHKARNREREDYRISQGLCAGTLGNTYDVRALLGVLTAEPDASKGIVATTSGFAPKIENNSQIAQFLPTRLELIDGQKLRGWLNDLSGGGKSSS